MTEEKEFKNAIESLDFNKAKKLLNTTNVNPCFENNFPLIFVVAKDHYPLVELFINDKRINPSEGRNCAIHLAIHLGLRDITQLLWNHPKIKKTLYKDYPEIIIH
jgi:hypothetical protein